MFEPRDARFETDRVKPRGIVIGFAIVAAGIVFALIAAWFLSAWTGNRNGTNDARLSARASPTVQSAPLDERAKYEKEKRNLLHGYGWVGAERQHARIPVEAAMRMMAKSSNGERGER